NGGGLILIGTNAEARFRNLSIYRNSASNRGAGVFIRSSTNTILYNLKIEQNRGSYGGGIFALYGSLTLINAAIFNNVGTTNGTALYNSGANTELINCTVNNNRATENSASILYNRNDNSAGNLRIVNSIIWNSEDDRPSNILFTSGQATTSVSYSIIKGGYAGIGNSNLNPILVENYKITSYSPAINHGSAELYPESNEYGNDLDGNERIFQRNNGGLLDIGAVETDQRHVFEIPEDRILYVDANIDVNSSS